MKNEITICNYQSCNCCPFYDSCGLDFPTTRPKDRWVELIQEKIDNLNWLLEQINKNK